MIAGLFSLEQLKESLTSNPDRWRPMVFTNGCFDLLHVGHSRYLTAAKSLGVTLVVGLNSDASVRTIKPAKPGYPPRPIVPELQRAELLLALKAVDAVVLFEETTAARLIQELQPDIYVKGGDYTLETLPEATQVLNYGGKVELVAINIPTSTSGIIQQILANASVECQ